MKIIAQSKNSNIGGTGVTGVLLLLLIIGTVSPTLIVGTVNQPPLQSTGYIGYIEPGLRTLAANQKVSVIISGTDVHQITSLVEQAGGQISSQLWLIDSIAATIPVNALNELSLQPVIRAIVRNKEIINTKNSEGKEPSTNNGASQLVTSLSWPMVIDIGADQLHSMDTTGMSVTVAVVDSGVFFSPELIFDSSRQDSLRFVGQANFADKGRCPTKAGISFPLGLQMSDHCFQSFLLSMDRYGHGSHVAGIIGNRFQDAATKTYLGVAPDANILSVRVLDENGMGTYEDVIKGIQYVVEKKDLFKIRVMNLSLSASATVPYFVDPLNRAVEKAWQAGIVVVAAAGNEGSNPRSITVPGNDPYIITVGAINTQRTAGNWADDILPTWSSSGPSEDGFLKPDVVAPGSNIVSFMYNNPSDLASSAYLALQHPDYSANTNLFRMSGTSMATAATSGVVALMLQAQPKLTPDQVKFRLKYSARLALTSTGELAYSPLQQGVGRIWAPDAVMGTFPANDRDNLGMDLAADLAHSFDPSDFAFHYQGPVQRAQSDKGNVTLYYMPDALGQVLGLGAVDAKNVWLNRDILQAKGLTWNQGAVSWQPNATNTRTSSYAWGGGGYAWSGGGYAWSGGGYAWSGGGYAWSGGGASTSTSTIGATRWVDDK